ncbi:MAG: EamA family transporter [Opitutaceae bacterium]|nr:EamA family transporter [Opitutaceae bacterium]
MNWLHWSLLSALFAGLTAVLAKVGVAEINSHLATAIRTLVVLVITWGVALVASPAGELAKVPSRAWGFLIASGIATGLSWLCYFRALQLGEVSRVAPVDKLGLLFALLLAAVFLRERLTWPQWAGIALIVAGVYLISGKSAV